jgi:hypothetical protein
MLKISPAPGSPSEHIFRLEGRIGGPWVDEVGAVCDAALGKGRAVTLDLAGVSFVDRQGASLLLALARRGVALVGSTSFVAGQLQVEGLIIKKGTYGEAEERV